MKKGELLNMKKNFKWLLSVLIAVFAVSMIGNTAFADGNYDNIKDGEYKIDVRSLEKGTDKESVANDFVHDPTLTIQDGNPTLTLGIGAGGGGYEDFDFTIEWVTVEGKEPIGESDEGDFTHYTFQLDNLDTIVPAGMKYVVPDFPPLADGHEVGFDLELIGLDDLPEIEDEKEDPEDPEDPVEDPKGDKENGTTNGAGEGTNGDENGTTNGAGEDNGDNGNGTTDGDKEENPQTGDNSNILLYSFLLIGALVPLAIKVTRRFV